MNLLCIIFFSLTTLILSQPACQFSHQGENYDLSPLAKAGVLQAADAARVYTYFVTICGNNVPQPCELNNNMPPAKLYCPQQVGYCQQGTVGSSKMGFCIGITTSPSQTTIRNCQIEIIYTEPNQRLPGDGIARVGKVTIKCNPGGALVSNLKAISPSQVTDYEFHFDSYAACPLSLSGGSIILIIFFVLVFVYLAGGIGYNYFKNNARTPQELFPHLEFWKTIPGLVQLGITFTIRKFRVLIGKE